MVKFLAAASALFSLDDQTLTRRSLPQGPCVDCLLPTSKACPNKSVPDVRFCSAKCWFCLPERDDSPGSAEVSEEEEEVHVRSLVRRGASAEHRLQVHLPADLHRTPHRHTNPPARRHPPRLTPPRSLRRSPGAAGGFSGSTASRVPGRRGSPASVTEPVWTGPTAPGSVSAAEVSMGRPARPARAGSTESTVTKVSVCLSVSQDAAGPKHLPFSSCLRLRLQERAL